jgi:hypothetical protein
VDASEVDGHTDRLFAQRVGLATATGRSKFSENEER